MPLVLAPPLNLQRTLSPAVRRLPALLGRSAIAVADALKSALRLLPAQILRELAHVIKRTAALPALALEITLRFAVG
jgi:hypothetical protein